MNHNCCCLLPGQRCTSTFQSAAKGNRIAVIAESPTNASTELDMPLVGKTGAALCSIFECLRAKFPQRYDDFCLRRVMLFNVSPHKIRGCLDPIGEGDYRFILPQLKKARIVICVGAAARDVYQDLKCELTPRNVEIELCHLSVRGIAGLSKWHPKNGRGEKPVRVREHYKYEVIADWIDKCVRAKGSYSIGEFEKYYACQILQYIPSLRPRVPARG